MNIFTNFPSLENDRVLLRPLELTDTAHLRHLSETEPDLWQYSLTSCAGEENLHTYISTAIHQRDSGRDFPFIVFDKVAGQYAGSTRFYDIQQAYSSTQLGYTWYGKAFQRTGLNRHCKFLLLSFVFEQWGLERCEFRADARNARSIAAMKAIGCVEEGILRSHMPDTMNGRRDSIVLSILRPEWMNGGREQLLALVNRPGLTGN